MKGESVDETFKCDSGNTSTAVPSPLSAHQGTRNLLPSSLPFWRLWRLSLIQFAVSLSREMATRSIYSALSSFDQRALI